jgi:hypothetical protein
MHAAQQWVIEANKGKRDLELPSEYRRHREIFSEEGALRFPPARPDDLVIKLKLGAPEMMNTKIYPMSQSELVEWRVFVKKNMKMKQIKESKSRWAAPVFFIKKKDGSFRLVQDYREVNKWTERNVYPLPRIEQILEQLHGKTLFMALDIRDGYNNIRVKPEDRWKLAFKGPDGVYEPGVMFFGMSNAPATFQRAMDRIFRPLKDRYPGCIFVYMDDILIATNDDEELHKRIVHEVLDLVEQEDFFLKLNKCLFHQRSIDYLGIRIEGGRISIDPTKLDGLAHWKEELRNVHEVRSTLGVFGYNQPFIPGYSNIVQPLTNLTKKDVPFVWTAECTNTI